MLFSSQVTCTAAWVLLRQVTYVCPNIASSTRRSLQTTVRKCNTASYQPLPARQKSSKYDRLLQASLGPHIKNRQVVQKLQCEDGMVAVTWTDNSISKFHAKWLWYNCTCSKCMQLHSGQKLLQPRKIPQHLTPVDAVEDVTNGGAFVKVKFQETDHRISLPQEWLWLNSYSKDSLQEKTEMRDPPHFQQGPIKCFDFLKVSDKESDDYFDWLHALNLDGLTLVTNVPPEREKGAEVGELIGPVSTNLYGKFCDVTAVKQPINIAYSSASLPLHQDLTHYESPSGLQLLHCLKFCPQVVGGETTFVDAFYVAERLRKEFPNHFQTLLKVPATFKKIHFERDNPAAYLYQRPHITVNGYDRITNVTWSPPFEGPLQVSEELVEPYFEAYGAFAEMLDKTPVIMHRMVPGDCIIVNNRRMLHGRNPFQLNGGERFLQCCYVNTDDYIQRVQVMHLKRQTGQLARRVGNQCQF